MPTDVISVTGTWTAPTNIDLTQAVLCEAWGPGGDATTAGGGAGGGGGAYASRDIKASISAGSTYNITIGTGLGGFNTTQFDTGTLVKAKGGLAASGGIGGTGGAAASSVGTTKHAGGSGGDAGSTIGGGGGGSATSTAVGGDGGAGDDGGAAGIGQGNGGAGAAVTGGAGVAPGGGGGGGLSAGGIPGVGRIQITYQLVGGTKLRRARGSAEMLLKMF